MKDEIKEILELNGDKYKVCLPKEVKEAFNCIDYELSVCSSELPKILDYITNLQDYKSRIEKAIEYINQNKHLSMFADCREPEEDWNYDLEINPRDLLNILQGVGKDE